MKAAEFQWVGGAEREAKYYTQPFTVTLLTRQNTNLMSYSCEENEIDCKGGHINTSAGR